MDTTTQAKPASGDYYGVIYKGSLILPLLVMIVLAIAIWWFLKNRKSTK